MTIINSFAVALGSPAARAPARSQRGLVVCSASSSTVASDPADNHASSKQQVVSYDGVQFVVDDNPELRSTWLQRATVAASASTSAALLLQGWTHCDQPLLGVCAMLAGYVFADFGSGVYHWSVDNYGSSATPIVGSQIAAFQGHHQRPWTITQREFCNNCSLTFKPAGFAALFFLTLSLCGMTPAYWDIFAATSIVFIALSQQFHAWSHMRKSELPGVVVALQDANVIISRKAHGVHHRSPFNINYSIVSGWTSPILDSGLMLVAERLICKMTGVEPRGWHEPLAEWQEEAPPSATRL